LCALERHAEQMQMLAMMPHWLRWRGLVERCHTPCPHASGWWLPEGARLPFFDPPQKGDEVRTDEVLLEDWLLYHARREVMAHRIGWIAGGYRTR
jgi:hypothetical protein